MTALLGKLLQNDESFSLKPSRTFYRREMRIVNNWPKEMCV